MRLPRRPTGAPPGLGGSLASGLSARAASTLLAALLATAAARPTLGYHCRRRGERVGSGREEEVEKGESRRARGSRRAPSCGQSFRGGGVMHRVNEVSMKVIA